MLRGRTQYIKGRKNFNLLNRRVVTGTLPCSGTIIGCYYYYINGSTIRLYLYGYLQGTYDFTSITQSSVNLLVDRNIVFRMRLIGMSMNCKKSNEKNSKQDHSSSGLMHYQDDTSERGVKSEMELKQSQI